MRKRDNRLCENVIVIGGNHHNTLGVVRSLGQRGIGVELIIIGDIYHKYVSTSKYVVSHHALLVAEELSAYLLFRKKRDEKEVIISCSDEVTEHLNSFVDILSPFYYLPGTKKQGDLIPTMDKTTMIQLADKNGLRSPLFWRLPEEKNRIFFPCISKTCISSHGSKQDIKVFYSIEELDSFLERVKGEIFIQEFVDKKEEIQLIGCSLRGGADIIIPGMSRIIRSQSNTNTGFLEYGPIDPFYNQIIVKCKSFLMDCDYSGLFSLEFLRDKKDNVYFLEINFRNDGNAFCVTAAGVNLPMIWYKGIRGLDYSDELHPVKRVLVMPEFQDFKLVLQGKIKLLQWLKDLKNTDAFLDWDRTDVRPFFRYILNKI